MTTIKKAQSSLVLIYELLLHTRQGLLFLIMINAIWSILGIYADAAWLSRYPWYLMPLTAICSLYPVLLTIIYLFLFFQRHPPVWLARWAFIGCLSYGILAQIYFPLLMSWRGFGWYEFGSMFWVAFYGLQVFLIAKFTFSNSKLTFLPAFIWLTVANLFHYFWPTFMDFTLPGYPVELKYTTTALAILFQIFAFVLVHKLNRQKHFTRP